MSGNIIFSSKEGNLSLEPSFSLFEETVKNTDTCKHDISLMKIWHGITRFLDQLQADTKMWPLIDNITMQIQCNHTKISEISIYFFQ